MKKFYIYYILGAIMIFIPLGLLERSVTDDLLILITYFGFALVWYSLILYAKDNKIIWFDDMDYKGEIE